VAAVVVVVVVVVVIVVVVVHIVVVIVIVVVVLAHVARMLEERELHRVLVGKPEGKSRWGDPDVDGRIILRWMFRKWDRGDWKELAQDRDRWRALVSTVKNPRVP
jgi:hypothetical protein